MSCNETTMLPLKWLQLGALRLIRSSYCSHIAAGAMAVAVAASALGQPSETVAQQLAALHALVLDPLRTFSISQLSLS